MPVLKQPGPPQPRRRAERGALSISAPLGDVRHTLRGRGGDAFGDPAFLRRHGDAPPPEPRAPVEGAPRPAPPPPPANPLLSFHLDLGPSMPDAVLSVMDAEREETAAKPDGDAGPGTPGGYPGAGLQLDQVLGL
ncbi:LOW QUALITY PROTEIN: cdc42 effector protein 5 [Thomomys bottae]